MGRPRLYADAASKQADYRDRQRDGAQAIRDERDKLRSLVKALCEARGWKGDTLSEQQVCLSDLTMLYLIRGGHVDPEEDRLAPLCAL